MGPCRLARFLTLPFPALPLLGTVATFPRVLTAPDSEGVGAGARPRYCTGGTIRCFTQRSKVYYHKKAHASLYGFPPSRLSFCLRACIQLLERVDAGTQASPKEDRRVCPQRTMGNLTTMQNSVLRYAIPHRNRGVTVSHHHLVTVSYT